MVVRCERSIYGQMILLLCCIVFAFFIYSYKAPFLHSLLLLSPVIILSIIFYISVGRTLLFEKDGCTITILWYKKRIPWDQLKYIRAESYKGWITYRDPYEKAILFSIKKIRKLHWIKPTVYRLFSPTSFFYVTFLPDPPLKTDAFHPRYPHMFCYDEKIFVKKMKEWNIPIENFEDVFKALLHS